MKIRNSISAAEARQQFKTSPLERRFEAIWQQRHPDIELEREVCGIPGRRFRYDFACSKAKVAVEIMGGVWGRKSAHNSGTGIERDHEKQCLGALAGWVVFPVTERTMTDTTLIDGIADMIRQRQEVT